MATSSAFYRLSEELLTEVVSKIYISELPDLRLVHPRFAYLKIVMRNLFWKVNVSTKPECLDRLDSFAWETLAPFAKCIKIRHSPYSPDLTYEALSDLIEENTEKDDGVMTRTKLKEAYAIYSHHANGTKKAMSSGRAEFVLSSTLERFPNARHFILAGPIHMRLEDDIAPEILDVLRKQTMDHCRVSKYAASLGDEILQLVTDLIHQKDLKLTGLEVFCASTGDVDALPVETWRAIDANQMQKFVYDGTIQEEHGYNEERRNRLGTLSSVIANRAASSLRHLEITGPWNSDWPTPTAFCAQLKHFRISIYLDDSFDDGSSDAHHSNTWNLIRKPGWEWIRSTSFETCSRCESY